jgi:hypothetical protein
MQDPTGTPTPPPTPIHHRDRNGLIGGLVLVTLGLLFLADNFIPDVRFGDFWPLILVVIGAGMLWRTRKT